LYIKTGMSITVPTEITKRTREFPWLILSISDKLKAKLDIKLKIVISLIHASN